MIINDSNLLFMGKMSVSMMGMPLEVLSQEKAIFIRELVSFLLSLQLWMEGVDTVYVSCLGRREGKIIIKSQIVFHCL